MLCKYCKKELKRRNIKYCNNICQQKYIHEKWILRWQNGEETGLRGKYQISSHIRKYLQEKYDNKCSRCGWHEVNPFTNKVPLEIEHIDGNYLNNAENNLDFVCPNCHSLTSTYKGVNRGKGRKNRNKYYLS